MPSKTKIVVTNPNPAKGSESIPGDHNWVVDGVSVPISQEATHLGIVRSSHHNSNSPAVMSRIAAHSRAFFGAVGLGLAKNHRTPPSTSLKLSLSLLHLCYSVVLQLFS